MRKRTKKRRAPNPCIQKGLYGGRGYTGRTYAGGKVQYHGCECNQPFYSCYLDTLNEKLRYGVKCNGDGVETFRLADGKKLPKRTLQVIPCEESFLHEESKGTQFFKKRLGKKTKFRGCQEVEETLVREKLIRHKPIGDLGFVDAIIEGTFVSIPSLFPGLSSFSHHMPMKPPTLWN